jgi:transposase
MEDSKRGGRRRHGAELKAKVLAECGAPGASVAQVALAHGLNANLVHKWRRQAGGGMVSVATHEAPAFIPVAMAPAAAPVISDIRIELRRGAIAINVTWPMAASAQCAGWLLAPDLPTRPLMQSHSGGRHAPVDHGEGAGQTRGRRQPPQGGNMAQLQSNFSESAGVDSAVRLGLHPPFEFEEVVGEAATRYTLDCMPNVTEGGRFKAHLVIRSAETGRIIAHIQPATKPYETAEEACRHALQVGRRWLQQRVESQR